MSKTPPTDYREKLGDAFLALDRIPVGHNRMIDRSVDQIQTEIANAMIGLALKENEEFLAKKKANEVQDK